MIVSDLAVDRRTAVFVLMAFITVSGLWCYFALPREAAPDVTIPNVFIATSHEGVSPEDVEKQITIEIEKRLRGISGVKKVRSVSREGYSAINVEFVTGTDIDDAIQKVKDKVDLAEKDLPVDLEEDPAVFEVNFSELPVLVLALSGRCSLRQLKDIGEDLKEAIETVPGVLEVVLTGGLEREIHIEVDPHRLAYYGVPFHLVSACVTGENQNVSSGTLRMGQGRYQIRVPGEFKSVEEAESLVVHVSAVGTPIYLKDVARVTDSHKDVTSISRIDSLPSVNLAIKKRTGENIIEMIDAVDRAVARERERWPGGLRVTRLMDGSKEIRLMIADLENNMLSGLVLVLVVVCAAMGLRNAMLVTTVIPLSMLLSFSILYALGITLNMVVLFSLTMALGMLVDNAIVIVENIYRFAHAGIPRIEAAKRAASEVAYPVISSTATTVAAFVPLLFWTGIMGEFMVYLPITVIVTLTSSLFVAMVMNPALCSMLVKGSRAPGGQAGLEAAVERPSLSGGNIVVRLYRAILRTALRNRICVLALSGLLVALAVQYWLLRVGLDRPVEFFPKIDPRNVFVNIDPPQGASAEGLDRVAQDIERRAASVKHVPAIVRTAECLPPAVRPQDDANLAQRDRAVELGVSDLANIEHVYAKIDVTPETAGFDFSSAMTNHVAIQMHDFAKRVAESSSDTAKRIQARMRGVTGAKVTVEEAKEGPPTGAPINIEISGDDFRVLGPLAGRIRAIIEQIPHVRNLRDDLVQGNPTFKLNIDRQKAALLGLSTSAIGQAVRTAIHGSEISTYREGEDDYDIVVRLTEAERSSINVLDHLMLPSASGQLTPLTTVAQLSYTSGAGAITRVNYKRVVTIKADVDEAKVPGAVARMAAEKLLRDYRLPPGCRLTFTGENEFQRESEDFLSRAMVVALFLITMVLVVQFNSVGYPLIIMTSVLLSTAGVFWGLGLLRMPFGVIMTGVGAISLAGVVVNNAIVLIDYINQLRSRGMDLTDAVVAGGATRLRPVLLTAVTTVLGLIPMATGVSYDFHTFEMAWTSESSQWWRSMAVAVIYGLSAATVMTLVVIPVMYHLMNTTRDALGQALARLKRA